MAVSGTAAAHDHSHGHHDHGHHHHHHDELHGSACCELHGSNPEKAIVFALVGGTLVLTTVVAGWLDYAPEVAQIPAMLGAIVLGIPLVLAAFREIRNGRPSSSVLVALAIGAAFAVGEYVTAGGLAFILYLMDAVLRRTAWGAQRAIESLVQLTPDVARLVTPEGEREVPLSQLTVGSVIRVRPGENMPADGTIVSGRSNINQASLTGESAPVAVSEGDPVYAGTTNLTGSVEVEITRLGSETAIGKVVTLINEAEQSKTPRQQIIEMVAGHYVWLVLLVALAVWIFSDKSGDVAGAMSATNKAIAVLVVTCPGALLLASPTAMVAAFASAARLGIMIKSAETLEAAASVDTVVLDKTGTITTGRFVVSRLAPAEGVEGADLLKAAATAEQHSNHPLAAAILETARAARVEPDRDGEAEEVHGMGVRLARPDGELFVGRAKWLLQRNPQIASAVESVEGRIEGTTGVHVMLNGRYLGAVGLEDKIRPGAREAIAQMRETGVRLIWMLTGDRHSVAERVGQSVGVDRVEAECHPEEKHARVVELTEAGRRVMMVGDGINDGPSLAAADVGVAMGLGGTDIAANSAGIALMNDDLERIPFVIQLARKTRAVIAQNIAAAILIAVVGIVLAASGQLGSYAILIAAVYHSLGDIFVIGNSFRLVRFGEDLAPEAAAPSPMTARPAMA